MATARKKVGASARHLSCADCRIRIRASAAEIGLLEGSCPICGASLQAASAASGVIGFRSFDLDPLREQGSADPSPERSPGEPINLGARRDTALGRDALDADRWVDEGGSLSCEAVAEWPAAR
jgi:hypothetical protein